LSSNSSYSSSIHAVEVPITLQRTVIRRIGTSYTIKETPGSITSVTFCAGFTVWTANTIIARSTRARSSRSTYCSSIYAEEVPITLQRTVIRRIGTSYTIKETPGSITSVTFCAGFTVWTANTIIARSTRARSSRSTYCSSIYAEEVPITLQRTVIRRIGTSYTIKETPGSITTVAFNTSGTVCPTNIVIARGARARPRQSANLPSIDAVKVSVRSVISWF
jgi:hypothetical protein